jgi:periplasmic divalent cation tolerance protein
MSSNTEYCVVLTTTGSSEQAEELAKKIVEKKLAACVQVQQIRSYYMWKGEACNDPECLLFIKARIVQYKELEAFIRKNHTYDTPEIVQLPITAGFSGYLSWIDEVTSA